MKFLHIAIRQDMEQAVQRELALLEGGWHIASAEQNGNPYPLFRDSRYVCTGNSFMHKLGHETVEASFRVDPAAKPKTVDVTYSAGPDEGKTRLGIYLVEGDHCKVCLADFGQPRPTTWGGQPGQIFFIAKRATA